MYNTVPIVNNYAHLKFVKRIDLMLTVLTTIKNKFKKF